MTASIHRAAAVALCAIAGLALLPAGGQVLAAESPVGLGSATGFAVLAGTTVTNTGPSTVAGDLGVSPGSAVTGFPPGVVSNGAIHAADADAAAAQAAVGTAFNDAAGRASSGAISADLAGQTLTPGVYTGGALALSGTLVLDAQGDPNAVFIFQAASTLVVGSSSAVSLINGAGSCNVFWQVGSSATIGTSSQFVGTVLALASITAQTDATIEGRLLAMEGAVTLDANTFVAPSCQAAVTTSSAATGTTAVSATTVAGNGGGTGGTIPATGTGSTMTLTAGVIALALGAATIIGVRRPHLRPLRH